MEENLVIAAATLCIEENLPLTSLIEMFSVQKQGVVITKHCANDFAPLDDFCPYRSLNLTRFLSSNGKKT